ncbi:TIM barrel protein [Stappia sp. F7233]|uniref:TIM barrel protein n=1 Tax=Stappia albiluteola TaxID=2758565 RepID=A0A839AH96_9HYPH|nr:TIM barrel protein [Stappia albiluteola]MBA5778304.1 TIM barrel protein [Stappia albiluteola]
MLQLTANISLLFTEMPFLDRFAAARAAGFDCVECHFPYEHSIETLAETLEKAQVKLTGINTQPGDMAKGEFGTAAVPGQEAAFEEHFQQALSYAQALGVPMIHVMAGVVQDADREAAEDAFVANLSRAAEKAQASGITLLIEPLNGRDRPHYFLRSVEQASSIIDRVGSKAVKILFDVYHVQILQGDIVTRLDAHWHNIGHIQIAAVPDRGEPDAGEINYPYVIEHIHSNGYRGLIGAEYKPRTTTEQGLAWAWAYGLGRTGNPE